ncbi:hypothetical protein EU546_03825 [Candidatus Thorarchaeota archaeon]|nr:MAG: hypothetical protein EU546_03825 [Candidatus Thorarchaeota archaeon]
MNIESLLEGMAHGRAGDVAQSLAAMCRIGAAKKAGEYLVSVVEDAPTMDMLNDDDILEVAHSALKVYSYHHDQAYLLNIRPLLMRVQKIADDSLTRTEMEISEPPPDDIETPLEISSDEESAEEEGEDWVERLRTEMDEIREAADSEAESPKAETGEKHYQDEPATFAEYTRFVRLSTVLSQLLSFSDKIDIGEHTEMSDLAEQCRARAKEMADALRTGGEPPEELEVLTLLETASLFGLEGIDPEVMRVSIDSLLTADGLIRTSTMDESDHGCVTATLQMAHYYSRLHNGDRVENILEALSDVFSEYHMLPDFVISTSPLRVAGQRCSAAASSLLLVLLLDMIGYERAQDLIVLSGVPDGWYTSLTPLTVKDLNLESGSAQVEVGISANQHQIDVRTEYLPQELEVHVPVSRAMPMVKVYGGGVAGRFEDEISPHIRIVPLSDNVVLTFHK